MGLKATGIFGLAAGASLLAGCGAMEDINIGDACYRDGDGVVHVMRTDENGVLQESPLYMTFEEGAPENHTYSDGREEGPMRNSNLDSEGQRTGWHLMYLKGVEGEDDYCQAASLSTGELDVMPVVTSADLRGPQ